MGRFLQVTHLFIIRKIINYIGIFNNALGGVNMANVILRLPHVKKRTGLSRSTIYLRISNNEFPAPISLGGRAVGWVESEIDDWLTEKIETSRLSK